MKNSWVYIISLALLSLSSYCVSSLYQLHAQKSSESLSRLADIPEPIARAMALEYSGISSDFLMLKVLTFLGQKIMDKEELTKDEWHTTYRTLKQVTNLDPRFVDPYVVAQMTLPFEAGMVDETNTLLEKAAQIRQEDYRPNFYLWYNHLYFLNNPEKAGKYLEKAARMPGAPTYFATLASRMHYYAGNIKVAIIFLEENLRETTDPSLQEFLSTRIAAFKKIGFLESKILEFRKQFNKTPKQLQELVESGLIARIPDDPYGGEFYIMEGGRVYSTSKLVFHKKQ